MSFVLPYNRKLIQKLLNFSSGGTMFRIVFREAFSTEKYIISGLAFMFPLFSFNFPVTRTSLSRL